MNTVFKILLINLGLALLFAFLFSAGSGGESINSFVPMFGLVSLFGGVIDLIVGLTLLAVKRREWAQGYLLSAGVLLLLGFLLCSGFGVI